MRDPAPADGLHLIVRQATALTSAVRELRLANVDGALLEPWSAGAHVDITLPNGDKRSYSLVNTQGVPHATRTPSEYRLGVRLETPSKGGSAYMHGLSAGDRVLVSRPKNHFPLAPTDAPALLLAGGIGITPIVSMAAELAAQGKAFRLVYAGRSRRDLALMAEVHALCAEAFTPHHDDEHGMLDIRRLLADLGPSQHAYVCGPKGMIDAAIQATEQLGWESGRLHYEVFAAAALQESDAHFEVVLAQSGKRVTVQANQSIVQALKEAGETPEYDCLRGDCGMCQVAVLEGIPDHRDYYLSKKERASNKLIQICVSRALTPTLVLDL